MKDRTRIHTLSRLCILAFCGSCLVACHNFSDQTHAGNLEKTVFDSRFGDALEEVFTTCSDPLTIEPGDSNISLMSDCHNATDVSSTNGQLVASLLLTQGTVDLAEPIASRDGNIEETINDLPWPIQNCEIQIDATIFFNGINLYDLDSNWVNRDGEAAFKIDFDFNGTQRVADVDIDALADCPSAINRWFIQDRLDRHLNGRHQIKASQMDLDIWISFFEDNDEVATDLEVEFKVGHASIEGINWRKLFVDGSMVDNLVQRELQREANTVFEESLADLPAIALELLHYGIDENAPLCSIRQSNGKLTVKTGNADAANPCLQRVSSGVISQSLSQQLSQRN